MPGRAAVRSQIDPKRWLRDFAPHAAFALGLVGTRAALEPTEATLPLVATLVAATLLATLARRRWPDHAASRTGCVWAAAIAIGLLASSSDRRAYARELLPVLGAAGILLVVFFGRSILRRWRELVLLGATSAVLTGLLAWLSPHLLRWLVPSYSMDLDHRPKPFDPILGTNEDGVVARVPPSDFRGRDFNIVFLGDSFTQGLRAPQAFPAIVESLLALRLPEPGRRLNVANFGWTSSCPVLQVRQLQDIGAKYRPDLVVQCFDMTDFHDDLKYTAWFRERGVEPVQVTIFQAGRAAASRALGVLDYGAWLRSRLRLAARDSWEEARGRPRPRYFAVGQPLARTEPLLQTSWDAILATRDVAQRLGANYVLFVLPRHQQFNPREAPRSWETDWPAWDEWVLEPFEFFRRKAASAPFPIHSLLEAFRDSGAFPVCYEDDPHWNATGHRIAAQAIVEFLLADGSLGEPPP